GLLPKRARGLNRMLPTLGTGRYDWRGFIGRNAHPHSSSPPRGLYLNWNNKPAPRWIGGDDVHSWTSVHRVKMVDDFPRHPRLRLGDLTDAFALLTNPDQSPAGRNGSSFGSGWYGIVSKDLRTLLGRRVKGRYRLRYCGEGVPAACRTSLWAALDAAAAQLAA